MKILLLFLFSFPIFLLGQTITNFTPINITKTWAQEPSGWTYPMNIFVPNETVPDGGFPVCILLHGNGGRGVGMIGQWRNVITSHILVAPTGYEVNDNRSWNIADESSNAPDIEMIADLVDILQTFDNINPNKIRVLGTSNGAALCNRILIENKDSGIDAIGAVVSQLNEAQYHLGNFYKPSGETGDGGTGTPAYEGYDVIETPLTGRKYLSICNENDPVIPYTGGGAVGVNFLDAQEATYLIAKSQGYNGAKITGAGTQIESSTSYEYKYLNGQVTHIRGDARHASDATQNNYINSFFNAVVPTVTEGILTNESNINITKTWSQEPSGYTYPIDIHVPTGDVPADGFPVCISLHGNGGTGNVNAWKNVLPNHVIIAPSGYLRSWNIADENSNAPDVEMVSDLIDSLQTYTNINTNKIRIIGSSNGAGLANRIFIENKDTGVDIICSVVSHLTTANYHNDNFYYPSGDTGDNGTGMPPYEGYDTQTTPITGRRYLGISNTNDNLIPYLGGVSPVGATFLDAQLAAYLIAKSQGYTGTQVIESTQIEGEVYEFEYLSGQVVHLNGDAMHGTNDTQKEYIAEYFNRTITITPSCEMDVALSSTVNAGTYRASNTITCNKAVSSGSTVVFEANSIILTAGFVVEANTNFTARIAPCSPLQSTALLQTKLIIPTNYSTEQTSIESKQDNTFKIYPNPANDFVQIQGDFDKTYTYTLLSPYGQQLQRGQLTGNNQQIDLSDLPPNFYYLRMANKTYKLVVF